MKKIIFTILFLMLTKNVFTVLLEAFKVKNLSTKGGMIIGRINPKRQGNFGCR